MDVKETGPTVIVDRRPDGGFHLWCRPDADPIQLRDVVKGWPGCKPVRRFVFPFGAICDLRYRIRGKEVVVSSDEYGSTIWTHNRDAARLFIAIAATIAHQRAATLRVMNSVYARRSTTARRRG
ncbi:MAG: hypothetical protein L6Q35_04835 [Phycisphaerales bacterium]|nr:hypothetical protein [Phycisphaerales bacterium]